MIKDICLHTELGFVKNIFFNFSDLLNFRNTDATNQNVTSHTDIWPYVLVKHLHPDGLLHCTNVTKKGNKTLDKACPERKVLPHCNLWDAFIVSTYLKCLWLSCFYVKFRSEFQAV